MLNHLENNLSNLKYSCTIPHKEAALKCMDEIDSIAKVSDSFSPCSTHLDIGLTNQNLIYITSLFLTENWSYQQHCQEA